MIEITLKGGLGNQLFQYALGRHLALIHNTTLELDVTNLARDPLRSYRLDSFNLPEKISIKGPPQANQNNIFSPFFAKFFTANRSREKFILNEKYFDFDPEILKCRDNIKLDGYWQSEKYFKGIEDIIKADLTLRLPLPNNLCEIKQKIQNTNSVSIHVRRGDYVSNPTTNAYHGVCSIEWYQDAVANILESITEPHFFVFSDDYEWAKSNIKLNAPTTYIEPSTNGNEAFDLILMSCCRHNIIANSSFSWWAAWLNRNSSKKVIAPKKWFLGAEHETNDLIPDVWARL